MSWLPSFKRLQSLKFALLHGLFQKNFKLGNSVLSSAIWKKMHE